MAQVDAAAGAKNLDATKKRKKSNEIDAIFSKKQKKQKKQSEIDTPKKQKEVKKSSKKKSAAPLQQSQSQSQSSSKRKKTEDGFNLYTEEELGCNRKSSGMTPKCPFDCDCCF